MDPVAIGNFLLYTGALGALVVFVVGLMRRYWRMENSHRELMEEKDKRIKMLEVERDDWKGIAFASNTTLSEFAARAKAARRASE